LNNSTDKIYLRINGRGNAWPIPLGKTHPFYDISNPEDYANSSFSIINENYDNIDSEVIIDAGHGIIQYLIKNSNRIPEAIFLTHPHHDHTFSIDWIIQSFYRKNSKKKKYPVYASEECIKFVYQTYPHLKDLIDFKKLEYKKETPIPEFYNLTCTAFPVYHGVSAKGSCMLMFKYKDTRKVIFTGDILFPIINDDDYKLLSGADILIADANNRFPYPNSNHWSVCNYHSKKSDDFINEWKKYIFLRDLEEVHKCKLEFNFSDLCLSIFDFSIRIKPKKIGFVHYSGAEDQKYYSEAILNAQKLSTWVKKNDEKKIFDSNFFVPQISDRHYF